MKVTINEKILSIPPHISTTWDMVTFLQSDQEEETGRFTLTVHLRDGHIIHIPHLDSSLIDIAFAMHIRHMESKGVQPSHQPQRENEPKTIGAFLQQLTGLSPDQITNMPIRLGFGGIEGMPGMMDAMQHNQSQAEAEDLPSEILTKVTEMLKSMLGTEIHNFPKPEPHCNCPHCQVARTLHQDSNLGNSEEKEELVSEEDLTFRDWEVQKSGDNLFIVTNPLDHKEQYSVYLGTPVGCTCGQPHCEHLKAVLYS